MRYRRVTVAGATYFFTVVTFRRQRLFADPLAVGLLEAAIQRVRERRPFVVEAQVVLPDHIHALWTLADDFDYATRWRLIKEAFTREYAPRTRLPARDAGRRARGEQTVWQRRYWEHLIRNDRDFSAHVEYIHFNPVRHGLVSAPRDWPHSTFLDWVARGDYDAAWGSQQPPKLPDWAGRE
jgi:REP-associated tyrosine transposase